MFICENYFSQLLNINQPQKIETISLTLFNLDKSSNVYALTYTEWQKLLSGQNTSYKIFLLSEKTNLNIVGFCIWLNIDNITYELINIVIDKNYQNQKLATTWLIYLCKQVFDKNNLWLEVRQSNIIAYNLYLKCGFLVSGIRKNYYPIYDRQQNNVVIAKENAVLMHKDLSKNC